MPRQHQAWLFFFKDPEKAELSLWPFMCSVTHISNTCRDLESFVLGLCLSFPTALDHSGSSSRSLHITEQHPKACVSNPFPSQSTSVPDEMRSVRAELLRDKGTKSQADELRQPRNSINSMFWGTAGSYCARTHEVIIDMWSFIREGL